MRPVTYFLTGWVLANCARLDRRERGLVTLAGVAPDVNGLGIAPEPLTRNSAHPLNWFSLYHHRLHTLAFSLIVVAVAAVLAARGQWLLNAWPNVAITIVLLLLTFRLARWRGFSPLE